ncbi:MAG TPA: hypothetical protein VF834_24180 [Streptosporangiaceae bacterium]
MSGNGDQLVADYLRRLASAASGLPDDRRNELLEEISAHIAEARASADLGDAGIRDVLDRLGDPAAIVMAAGPVAASPGQRPASDRAGAFEIVAVLFLLVGGLVFPLVGWVVGVVLLWASSRWQTKDKVLGTLIWPGGLLAPLVVFFLASMPISAQVCTAGGSSNGQTFSNCTGPAIAPWFAITIFSGALAAAIAGPILMAIRLLRQARRAPVPAGDGGQPVTYAPA